MPARASAPLKGRAAAYVALTAACYAGEAQAAANLFDRSIEELGELRVMSASRRSEPLRTAASSIYVITAEDIRRSGYTSIPEVLRLAPGVEVARDGTHSWTISIRGFNSDLSNKLLVLIDGRSVYSPLFAGVFWDAQDTLLQDIERIEVISGPGGTLWGSNAVNGVINIITHSATETQGTFLALGSGDEERLTFGIRHGAELAEGAAAARAYFKYTDRDPSELPAGGEGVDDMRMAQAGFRVDWESDPKTLVTLQGDVYDAELGSMIRGDFEVGTLPGPDTPGAVDTVGYNLLARWSRELASGGDLRLQAYYDSTSRDIPGSFNEDRDTLDFDFQHHFMAGKRHNLVWGAGFRVTSDQLDNTTFAAFIPDERTDRTYSVFIQDEIALWGDRASLIIGSKFEENDYTGFEVQPNIRGILNLTDRHMLWAAVSRAVRIPARLNTDLQLTAPIDVPALGLPLFVFVSGTDDYESEELLATEFGYRANLAENLSLDLSLYYNQYDRLQTQEAGDLQVIGDPPEYFAIYATLANGMEGDTWGGTAVMNWQPTHYWKLQFQYARIEFDLNLREGSTNTDALDIAGNSPADQAALYSYLELPYDFDMYAGVRYVDELPSMDVPDYTSVDLNIGWQATEKLRTALTVRNLTDETHLEFGGGNLIERSFRLTANLSFP